MKNQHLMTIKAQDKPGLLHHITGMINRKLIPIESLSAAKTDIKSIILITIELNGTAQGLAQVALKIENIIEVYSVELTSGNQTICLRAAYFKMAKAFMETPEKSILQKYNAPIVNFYPNAILVALYGTDEAIQNLYNLLDGPYLLGFSQTGLIADTKLIDNDDVRISWLAA